MMPLAIIMAWTWFRWLRWYGIFTCARNGWGARQNGAEVSLAGSAPAPAPSAAPPTAATPAAMYTAPAPETVYATANPWDENTPATQQYWPPTITSSP